MDMKIERKFLVDPAKLPPDLKGLRYQQGFLSLEDKDDLRIRLCEEIQEALFVMKGPLSGIVRPEFFCEISMEDGRALMELCRHKPIEKIRYRLEYEGHRWVVDEFLGENKGLWVAEIELKGEDEDFEKPPWLGDEVSYDQRYYNANLVRCPYSQWHNKPSGPRFSL